MSNRQTSANQRAADSAIRFSPWTYTINQAQLDVGAKTLQGRAHKQNEDQFLVAHLRSPLIVSRTSVPQLMQGPGGATDSMTVLAVADGVTGGGGGATASMVAIETLANVLADGWPQAQRAATTAGARQPAASIPTLREELTKAFEEGNLRIQQAASQGPSPRMGTTLTVAWLYPPIGYIAHVGDSRCYLAREGVLHQLTSDHTLGQALSALGERVEPDSPMHNILSRALGGGDSNDPSPDIRRINLLPGDTLLLASDGVACEVEPDALRNALTSASPAQTIANSLANMAQVVAGRDDMTAVVARLASQTAQ
jgi:serine/threonine protein phosphatase PrpC